MSTGSEDYKNVMMKTVLLLALLGLAVAAPSRYDSNNEGALYKEFRGLLGEAIHEVEAEIDAESELDKEIARKSLLKRGVAKKSKHKCLLKYHIHCNKCPGLP